MTDGIMEINRVFMVIQILSLMLPIIVMLLIGTALFKFGKYYVDRKYPHNIAGAPNAFPKDYDKKE